MQHWLTLVVVVELLQNVYIFGSGENQEVVLEYTVLSTSRSLIATLTIKVYRKLKKTVRFSQDGKQSICS